MSPSSHPANLLADSWSDIGSSQVCCVDVQTPNAATVTPVHSSNNNSNTHDLETACVFINSGDGGSNGNNGGSSVNGGCGVNSLSTKLNSAGSIRSRSLSPVQDCSTQTSTVAFNGDVNMLTNNHTKEIYAAQGARPKVRKSSQPKRPSSVRTLPSPTNNTYANGSISATTTTITTSTSTTTARSSFSSSSSSCSSVVPAVSADPATVPTVLTCSPVSPEPEVAGMLKRISSGGGESGPRWADPASHTIKYIDEEVSDSSELPFENNLVADCSSAAPSSVGLAPSSVILERRLYLAQNKVDGEEGVSSPSEDSSTASEGKPPRVQLQSVGVGSDSVTVSPVEETRTKCVFESLPVIPTTRELGAPASNLLSNGISGSDIEILHSASLPSSPIHGASKAETPTRKTREEVLKGKCRHLSPVLRRKGKHGAGDSVDDDLVLTVMEDFKGGQTYHNLETFQKAQLKHKVRIPIGKHLQLKHKVRIPVGKHLQLGICKVHFPIGDIGCGLVIILYPPPPPPPP